jgi:hypothetical protein
MQACVRTAPLERPTAAAVHEKLLEAQAFHAATGFLCEEGSIPAPPSFCKREPDAEPSSLEGWGKVWGDVCRKLVDPDGYTSLANSSPLNELSVRWAQLQQSMLDLSTVVNGLNASEAGPSLLGSLFDVCGGKKTADTAAHAGEERNGAGPGQPATTGIRDRDALGAGPVSASERSAVAAQAEAAASTEVAAGSSRALEDAPAAQQSAGAAQVEGRGEAAARNLSWLAQVEAIEERSGDLPPRANDAVDETVQHVLGATTGTPVEREGFTGQREGQITAVAEEQSLAGDAVAALHTADHLISGPHEAVGPPADTGATSLLVCGSAPDSTQRFPPADVVGTEGVAGVVGVAEAARLGEHIVTEGATASAASIQLGYQLNGWGTSVDGGVASSQGGLPEGAISGAENWGIPPSPRVRNDAGALGAWDSLGHLTLPQSAPATMNMNMEATVAMWDRECLSRRDPATSDQSFPWPSRLPDSNVLHPAQDASTSGAHSHVGHINELQSPGAATNPLSSLSSLTAVSSLGLSAAPSSVSLSDRAGPSSRFTAAGLPEASLLTWLESARRQARGVSRSSSNHPRDSRSRPPRVQRRRTRMVRAVGPVASRTECEDGVSHRARRRCQLTHVQHSSRSRTPGARRAPRLQRGRRSTSMQGRENSPMLQNSAGRGRTQRTGTGRRRRRAQCCVSRGGEDPRLGVCNGVQRGTSSRGIQEVGYTACCTALCTYESGPTGRLGQTGASRRLTPHLLDRLVWAQDAGHGANLQTSGHAPRGWFLSFPGEHLLQPSRFGPGMVVGNTLTDEVGEYERMQAAQNCPAILQTRGDRGFLSASRGLIQASEQQPSSPARERGMRNTHTAGPEIGRNNMIGCLPLSWSFARLFRRRHPPRTQ